MKDSDEFTWIWRDYALDAKARSWPPEPPKPLYQSYFEPNSMAPPVLRRSIDNGRTWQVIKELPKP